MENTYQKERISEMSNKDPNPKKKYLFTSTPHYNSDEWYRETHAAYQHEEYVILLDTLGEVEISTIRNRDNTFFQKVKSSSPFNIQYPNITHSELQALHAQLQMLNYCAVGRMDFTEDHRCDILRDKIVEMLIRNSHGLCAKLDSNMEVSTREIVPNPQFFSRNNIRIIINQDYDKFSTIKVEHDYIKDTFRNTILYFMVTNQILLVRQLASGYGDKCISDVYRLDDPNVDITQIVTKAIMEVSSFCKFVNEMHDRLEKESMIPISWSSSDFYERILVRLPIKAIRERIRR